MNMLEIYQHILNTCNLHVDDDGKVKRQMNTKLIPVGIKFGEDHRYLVLPTRENLNSPAVASYVIFHPFIENLARSESRVLSLVRKEFTRFYGSQLAYLMMVLVDLSSNGKHNDLTAEQLEIIGKFGKTDKTFAENFTKIIEKLARQGGANTPATISLRKGVTIGNRKYSRVATWSSPLVDEIDKTIELTEKSKDYKPKVFGVPVRKADLKTLKAVCHVFMPDIEKGAFYGVSDATDAPYIEAFIRAMKTLPAHTNKIAKAFFSGPYPIVPAAVAEEELLQTTAKIDWIEDEFSVSKWKSEYVMIPLQEGNEGNVSVEEATRSIPVQQEVKKWDTVSAPSNGNAAQQQPVQQVQAQAPQVQQPVYQQPIPQPVQPVQQPVAQPGNQFLPQQPVYQQPYQQAVPAHLQPQLSQYDARSQFMQYPNQMSQFAQVSQFANPMGFQQPALMPFGGANPMMYANNQFAQQAQQNVGQFFGVAKRA
uniref:Uncharacterized protein n=1 Tax=Myoviridae sp. ctijX18 TaxID=2825154 RepID=A0A8S5UT25_9CAUD|nr:MAG TPA: hypothetical protein [Myoviridae sp. ctijX18]DAQ61203.1 MAG TPA: hypothetical protein [Caudoviricetes sp.]